MAAWRKEAGDGMETGIVRFAEGEYFGQVVNGQANGFGYLKYNNGDIYVGEWRNNCQTGKGAKNTGEYAALGDFVNGRRQGKFCCVEKNVISNGRDKKSRWDAFYIGDYANNLKNGRGVYAEGNSGDYAYLGNFVNDKLNGRGYFSRVPFIASGSFEEGNFVNGKMVGKIYSYPRRESKTLSGATKTIFYGDSEETGWDTFRYWGFGVKWCELKSTKVIRIGYHNMNGSENFKGVKIYQDYSERMKVVVGDWGSNIDSKNGYFSQIDYVGNMDMGNYRNDKPCGKGISFEWKNGDNKFEYDDGSTEITIYPKSEQLVFRTHGTKSATTYYKNGNVESYVGASSSLKRKEILIYNGVLNGGKSPVAANYSVNANGNVAIEKTTAKTENTASYGNNLAAKPVKKEKTVDDYFDEFRYTGPYADLVADDMSSANFGNANYIEREKSELTPISTHKSTSTPISTPVQNEQITPKTYDYGDEYGEKISFVDRIKLEIANKKEMREAKNKANVPQKSTAPKTEKTTNERIKLLNEEYEFKDNRKNLVGVKVKKEIQEIPASVSALYETAFKGDTVVKKVKFDSYVTFHGECFRGCENLEEVVFLKGGSLSPKAFSDCVNLKEVSFKSYGLGVDGDDLFENAPKVRLYVTDLKRYYDFDEFYAEFLYGRYGTKKAEYQRKVAVKKANENKTANAASGKDNSAKVNAEPERAESKKAKSVTVGASADDTIGGAIVERRDNGVYLKGFVKKEETVFIPREVTIIDSASFAGIKDIVKDIIFEGCGIHELQTGVFDGLTNLEKVEASNVYFVRKKAFKDTVNLKSVTVMRNAKIKHGAFPKGLKAKSDLVSVGIDRFRHVISAKRFTFEKKKK